METGSGAGGLGPGPRDPPGNRLGWIVTFLVLAVVAPVLGFGGIAVVAADVARVPFHVFLAPLLGWLISRSMRGADRCEPRGLGPDRRAFDGRGGLIRRGSMPTMPS